MEQTKRLALSLILGGLLLAGICLWLWRVPPVAHAAASTYFAIPSAGGSCSQLKPCALADALALATGGDTIYLATGIYTGSGQAVVTVTQSITLYGGWDGAPSGPVVRDPVAYPSSLDGQEARRVVFISGTISPTLDGLIITGGNATWASVEAGCGGGIYSTEASPIIQHNVIVSNVGTTGGVLEAGAGIYGFQGAPIIEHNAVISNGTNTGPGWASGGGIFLWQATGGVVGDNEVIGNRAIGTFARGGGMLFDACELLVQGNLIQGNLLQGASTGSKGGGVYLGYSTIQFLDNEVRDNLTNYNGGGLHLEWSPSLVQGNLIAGNEAAGAGGGISVSAESPTITANRILSNTANAGAGLSLTTLDYFTVTNNLIAHNEDDGIKLWEFIRYGLVAHNTIVDNGGDGGIFVAYDYITPTIVNNIVVSNTYGIRAKVNSSGTLDYNDVWGNTIQDYDLPGALQPGPNSIQADPHFVAAAANDYHLAGDSPCIDVGLDAGVTVDIDGDPRPLDAGYDLGADEFTYQPPSSPYFAVPSAGGSCSQADPCALADALTLATGGDTIYLAEGTYTGSGQAVVSVTQSITLYGGWDGAPSGPVVRDPVAYPSSLDGQGARRVVFISGTISPTLDGLVITGGNATWAGAETGCGGGIYSTEASPIIQHNVIVSNVGTISGTAGAGGGIYGSHGAPLIEHNTVISNAANTGPGWAGAGGIYLWQATGGVVGDNEVIGNTAIGAVARGGGMLFDECKLLVQGNLIQGNTTNDDGGGVYLSNNHNMSHSTLQFLDNEIRGNLADRAGGLYLDMSPSLVQGNLIVENEADMIEGGVFAYGLGPTITANRILSNTTKHSCGGLGLNTWDITVTNNLIAHNSGTGISLQTNVHYGLIAHNTIVGNGGAGGIVLTHDHITPTIVNNIVVSNTYGIRAQVNSSGTLDYNDVWGNSVQDYDLPGALQPGPNSIQADPRFVAAATNNYHLDGDSPCIDVGLDAGVTVDIDGDPRPLDAGYDLGADEFTCLPLTGVEIDGPPVAVVGQPYIFVASISPSQASGPFNYTWSPTPASGQGAAHSTYVWTTTGSQTITLTVSNCGGSGTAGDSHVVDVRQAFYIYLPLVVRAQQ